MQHWTLVVINIFEQNIQYFDSSPGGKIFDWKHHPVIRIFEFLILLAKESADNDGSSHFLEFFNEWKFYFEKDMNNNNTNQKGGMHPQIKYAFQQNTYDCGMFVLVTAEILSTSLTYPIDLTTHLGIQTVNKKTTDLL